jgi:colanic acid biosynthesis glycosyl transferase WcaI
MKILLVSDAYPPEIRSASHLMQELAEELRDRGHLVIVATCRPQYNLTESDSRVDFPEIAVENGITIIRINTLPHHKVNFIIRGISQLTLPFIFLSRLKSCLREGVDAVLVYSPPLPLWKVGYSVKKRFGARFILNVQDIFPQNAIDLGALRNPALIRFFEHMERTAYRLADKVTVHSQGNRELLIRTKRTTPEKLVTLHNWVEIGENGRALSTGAFRKRLGLEDKFVFFFGGVLGPSQGLDLVIDAANRLKDQKDIAVLLAGDGAEKAKLEGLARAYELENVLFHPFVSKDDYRRLLKEIDVGLVCLTSLNKTPVVPGKILGYMASAVPVLAFLNRESDGHQVISDADCGYSAVSDRTENLVELMLRMYREKDRLKALGGNGRSYVAHHFSKEVCVDRVEDLLSRE